MAFETTLSVAVDTRKARAELGKLDKSLKKSGTSGEKTTKKLSGSFDKLKKSVFTMRSAFVALGAALVLKKFVQVGSTFEQLRIQLKTVTGSSRQAEKAFKDIQDLAVSTPFQVENLTTAFIRLKSIGIEPTTELMRTFGDVAAGLGRDVTDFTRAAVGAAFGETEALKGFGIAAKVEGEKINLIFKGVTTEVNKDVDSIIGALVKIGKENFAGAAQAQVNSFAGAMSNLADEVSALLDLIARTGILKTFADGIRAIASTANLAKEAIKGLQSQLSREDAIAQIRAEIKEQEKLLKAAKASDAAMKRDGGFGKAAAEFTEAIAEINPFQDSIAEVEDRLVELALKLKALLEPEGKPTVKDDPRRVKGKKFAEDTTRKLNDEIELLKIRNRTLGLATEITDGLIQKKQIEFEIRDKDLQLSQEEINLLHQKIEAQQGAARTIRELEEGKDIFDDNRTALEAYNHELAELQRLLDRGSVSQETFNRQQTVLTEELINSDPALSTIRDGMHSFSDSLVTAASAGESFADSMKSTFKSLVDDIIKQLGRVLIDKAFNALIGGSIGGGGSGGGGFLSGIFGSLFGGGGGASSIASLGITAGTPFAKGAAFNSGKVTRFASGGIVSGPTLFPMANGAGLMGEAGPEAVLPLSRGKDGKLGVKGGGGGTTIIMDLRGSNGEASIEAAVERGIRRAAPQLINASVKKVQSDRRRDPAFFGGGVG